MTNKRELLILDVRTFPKFLCAGVLVIVAIGQAFATSYAVIRWDGGVVAAADSRGVDINKNSQGNYCKIKKIRKTVYFTAAGTIVENGTDLFAIVRDSIDKQGISTGFRTATKKINSIFLEELKTDTELKQFVAENGSALTFVVYGYKSQIPFLYYAKLLPGGSSTPDIHLCPTDCGNGQFAYSTTPAGPFPKGAKTPLQAARLFVQQQIDKNDPTIGPPIQVLTVTHDGGVWDGSIPEPCK